MKPILLLIALLVGGCGNSVDDPKLDETQLRVVYDNAFERLGVIEVDGCEYLLYARSYGCSITHKANCTNKEHNP